MDVKNRIEVAKVNLKKAEQAKTIKETQKKAAEQQRDEVIVKLAQEGVTPETVAEEIAKLDSEIQASLTKVEGLIPRL